MSMVDGSKRSRVVLALLAAGTLVVAPASAQVGEVDLRTTAFQEPSTRSEMTVLMPAAEVSVTPWEFLTARVGWEADIVSGATEPLKAGPVLNQPDVVSSASISDTRNVFTGGVALQRKRNSLAASYTYAAESDYRSQSIGVSASSEFLQRNTQIQISYSRSFDEVCNQGYDSSLDPTRRPALDSSDGCFTSAPDRRTDDVDTDGFQGGWTQAWSPGLVTQLVLTGSLQHGFLSNPYRSVVLATTGESAQEFHPENRARAAVALRGKLYVRPLETAFGLGVRGYRDTWGILSETVDLEAERHMLSWLRLRLSGRYYNQSEALFWSDDYVGGEPRYGPRGRYFSGDRELSPLHSMMFGADAIAIWRGRGGDRLAGMFLQLRTGLGLDVVKTKLRDFTWGGVDPDDTTAFVGSLSLTASF